jgi:hypothetical protein
MHGRQLGRAHFGRGDVIEADHGQIFRNAELIPARNLHYPEGVSLQEIGGGQTATGSLSRQIQHAPSLSLHRPGKMVCNRSHPSLSRNTETLTPQPHIRGPAATFVGPAEGHDSAVVDAGISAQWTPCISTYVSYNGLLGRDRYDSNGVSGGIRIRF